MLPLFNNLIPHILVALEVYDGYHRYSWPPFSCKSPTKMRSRTSMNHRDFDLLSQINNSLHLIVNSSLVRISFYV